jgi:uncharacterized protein (TIGR01319 family)
VRWWNVTKYICIMVFKMLTDPSKLRTVLVTDCGSTTTKALCFQFVESEGVWRQTFRGEAPTTVEAPIADVTIGALNAFMEVEELSGRKITGDDYGPFTLTDSDAGQGIDLYLSTSSAGGGLQMLVAGVVRDITTESAERAALGAGAIVMEAVSADDGREDYERIERIRHIRPDIVLITGGIEGGSVTHVVEVAELLVAAAPRPRFGETLKLPVIYAGNSEASASVSQVLSKLASVVVVDNVRPTLESENIGPAREAIHELFLSHVMSHSPGYARLLSWTPIPVMPTPAAVGDMVSRFAQKSAKNVLCVDIGGATTDLFSVFYDKAGKQISNRTVSANLGMSYSIANVLVEAGVSAIKRWLPIKLEDSEVRDRLRNKMIRPTSIPQTVHDLWLEQAVCREALRLSLEHHRSLAVGLAEGGDGERGVADLFKQRSGRYELVDLLKLDIAIGSGGVLSHAPNRMQAAIMLIEGFALAGVTELAVDSIFMLPHLGVFSAVHPDAANQIFERDCLVHLGVCVAPIYPASFKGSGVLAEVFVNDRSVGEVLVGGLTHISLAELALDGCGGVEALLLVVPKVRNVEVGAGAGESVKRIVRIGECGLILDGRNRPFNEDSFALEARSGVFKELALL